MEAFLNKSLSPDERVYKAWYSKTFFVIWKENITQRHQFIPDETFKDLKCATDGLVLYLLLLKKEFPASPVVPYYVGSDINEQCFARVRLGRYSGRRTNLDCVILAQGMEKINITSALSGNEPFQIAHTRGKAVMKEAIPLPKDAKDPEELIPSQEEPPIWHGKSLNEQSIRNTMKNATKSCIEDCKRFGFPFFESSVYDPIPRTSSTTAGYSEASQDEEDDDEPDEEYVEDEPEDDDEDEGEKDPTKVKTPIGTLHLKTAEAIYLNGGITVFWS